MLNQLVFLLFICNSVNCLKTFDSNLITIWQLLSLKLIILMENVTLTCGVKRRRLFLMKIRCVKVLYDSWPAELAPTKKVELEEVAWSTIFLYLSENVIRSIGKTKFASEL